MELLATVPEPTCKHVIWVGEDRSAVAIHPGYLDRSPCGTGTSARMAQLHPAASSRSGRTSSTAP